MVKSTIPLPYELDKDDMLVVRGVPAFVCRQCGESFVEMAVVRELEQIVKNARKNGVTLGFIEYKNAA
jgi:YgiT-type zinc finger domain-containing protein